MEILRKNRPNLREELLRWGMNRESAEMYNFIHLATGGGRKGEEVFHKMSLVDRLSLAAMRRIGEFKPHVDNFERMYADPEFRERWLSNYRESIDSEGHYIPLPNRS
tara:strand:- start:3864 stop:4184 length:321 start_codon:yes stop_codon:yes gene_type:complete